jgi:HK97 gp10 family phage protein
LSKNEVEGVAELNIKLQRLARLGTREQRIEALMAGGQIVKTEAKRLVAVKTGATRDSIEAEPNPDNSESVIIGPHTPWAKWLEFGTRYMPARPFMRPALDTNVNRIRGVVIYRLRKLIGGLSK